MNRRRFVLGSLAGAFAAPLAAGARNPSKVPRIGFLAPRTRADAAPFVDGFLQGLRELGWMDGKNIAIDYRFADGESDRLPSLAAELVRLKVDVILAGSSAPAMAAKNATRTIPIVMGTSSDPVELGLVASLAHPSGNVTGMSFSFGLEIVGKELELLKIAVPQVRRVAVLLNPANPGNVLAMKAVKVRAESLGVQVQLIEARGPNDFEEAFAAMARGRAGALLVTPDPMFGFHRAQLQELVTRTRLPAMYGLREHTEAGGLMSYSVDIRESFRRAATYVDKILKGAKPGDLPIEQPSKLQLVINLKTAKAIGLMIPPSLLARADQVIE
jgi:putative ABC transport system substrate-binding protein